MHKHSAFLESLGDVTEEPVLIELDGSAGWYPDIRICHVDLDSFIALNSGFTSPEASPE